MAPTPPDSTDIPRNHRYPRPSSTAECIDFEPPAWTQRPAARLRRPLPPAGCGSAPAAPPASASAARLVRVGPVTKKQRRRATTSNRRPGPPCCEQVSIAIARLVSCLHLLHAGVTIFCNRLCPFSGTILAGTVLAERINKSMIRLAIDTLQCLLCGLELVRQIQCRPVFCSSAVAVAEFLVGGSQKIVGLKSRGLLHLGAGIQIGPKQFHCLTQISLRVQQNLRRIYQSVRTVERRITDLS